MPELVDVEGFRRVLAKYGTGRKIVDVEVRDTGVLRGVGAKRFRDAVRGHRFEQPDRHGKLLLAHTDGPTVAMHFGMTGSLVADDERHRHDRVVFRLDEGELAFRDMRKLTGLRLAETAGDIAAIVGTLGPDALEVSRDELASALGNRRRPVKAALMDQSLVAGLGNLLVDETLWRARVNPATQASELDDDAVSRIFSRMRWVLKNALPLGRVPDHENWLTGRRQEPEPRCPRCSTSLRSTKIGGRRAVWCPRCQPQRARK